MVIAAKDQAKEKLPLLVALPYKSTVAYYNGRLVSRKDFISHVVQVSKVLPGHNYCINLCKDRYHFLVVFTACVLMKQVSLLPGSQAEKEIARLLLNYQGSYTADDDVVADICNKPCETGEEINESWEVDADQEVAIVFTSGSTGTPQANPKTWQQLTESARRVKKRFGLNQQGQHTLVATVPPQHMFGFETTIVCTLLSGVAIHAGRPFYPLDIQQALSEVSSPRILVTTPVHLKACTCITKGWQPIDFVLSATATMPFKVAHKAEHVMQTKIKEIYGCSEAGAIATRCSTSGQDWKLLDDYRLQTSENKTLLSAPGYPGSIVLPDQLEVHTGEYFSLAGRNTDLIKVGGNRGSLSDLALKLKGLDGVDDAIFFMPDDDENRRTRLSALVVAPTRDINELRHELSGYVDSVFLPRPMIKVDSLPYNESGKLPRADLINVINEYLEKGDDDV